jgi:hypothetical protein
MRANYYLNSTIFTYDSSFSSTYYNGTACSWVYFQTSQHFFKGNTLGLGLYTKFIPGTATFNFTGTAKQTVSCPTASAQHWPDVNAPDNAGQLYFGTDVYVDGDIDLDKSFRNATGKRLYVAGDFSFDSAGTTPDTLQIAGLLEVTGNASSVHAAKAVSQNTACTLSVTGTAPTIDVDIATATFAKLKQAATTKSTHTGTGAATYTAGPLLGAMVLNQTGSTTIGHFRLDSLNIAAGTMAVTNHAGADSVTGSMWVNGTATLNASGDSIDFLGNATFAAGATHTTDASTLYRFFGNNAILTTAGKAQPTLQFYNNYRINDGATIRRLTWGTDGKQGTFEAGETWTLTNLATADWSGVLGSLNAMRSSVNGTAFVMAIPAGVTLNYVDTRDCRITGFTITCNNCITQGGNY